MPRLLILLLILWGCKGGGAGGDSGTAGDAVAPDTNSPTAITDSVATKVAPQEQGTLTTSPDTNIISDSIPLANNGEVKTNIIPEIAKEIIPAPIIAPIQESSVANPEPIVISPQVAAEPEVAAESEVAAEPEVASESEVTDAPVAVTSTSDTKLGKIELLHHFIKGPVFTNPNTKETKAVIFSYPDIKGKLDYSQFAIHLVNIGSNQPNQTEVVKADDGLIGKVIFSKIDLVNNELLVMTRVPMLFMRISLNNLQVVSSKPIFSLGSYVSNFIEGDGSFCAIIKEKNGDNLDGHLLFDDKVDQSMFHIPKGFLFEQYYCKDKKVFFVSKAKDKNYFSYYDVVKKELVAASVKKKFSNFNVPNLTSYLTYSYSNISKPFVNVVALVNQKWNIGSFEDKFSFSAKSAKIRSNDQYVIMQSGSGFYKLNQDGKYDKLGFIFGLVPSLGVVDFAIKNHYIYILTQSRQVWKVDLEKVWSLGRVSLFKKLTLPEIKIDQFSNFELLGTLPAVQADTKHLHFVVDNDEHYYHIMISKDLKNVIYSSNRDTKPAWKTVIGTSERSNFKLKLSVVNENKIFFIANFIAKRSMLVGSFDFEKIELSQNEQATSLNKIDRMLVLDHANYYTSDKNVFNLSDDLKTQEQGIGKNYFFSRSASMNNKTTWHLDLDYNLWVTK